jgi:hypothetical protein
LLLAVFKYVELVGDSCHERLQRLEHKYGKDVLSGRWNTLNRLLQICSKEAESASQMWNGLTASDLVAHVIDYIMWALGHEELQVDKITQEWLDKGRDGTPGAVIRVLAKLQLANHCEALVAELPDGTKAKTDLPTIMEPYRSYTSYQTAFAGASTPGPAATADPPEEVEAKPDPFEQIRESLRKTGCSVLDFLYDVFAGDHDKDLNDLLKNHQGPVALLPWSDLEGKAGTAWRGVVRNLGVHKKIVSASMPGAVLVQSARSLKRVLTEEGGDDEARKDEMRQERVDTWKNAQLARKKYGHVSRCNFSKA